MSKTLREQFIIALLARGETEVKRLTSRIVFTCKEGGFYYLGRSGSLRYGNTVAGSVPVSLAFKNELLGATNAPTTNNIQNQST